jgi:MerR family transcriptional regulator, light-induced transcriptional regulator
MGRWRTNWPGANTSTSTTSRGDLCLTSDYDCVRSVTNVDLLTTREAAEVLGVGTTSVKRWADSGLLRCVKTPGGHRRFPRDAVGDFLRLQVNPVGGRPNESDWIALLTSPASSTDAVYQQLCDERAQTGAWWAAADRVGDVTTELGRLWEIGALNVLHEHLAAERLARGLARCAESLEVLPGAPRCLLVSAPGDDHTLGLSLAEVCLREAGWNVHWAGRRTPTELVRNFVRAGEVEMVGLSASVYSTDTVALGELVAALGETCAKAGAHLVLGGAGLWPEAAVNAHRVRSFAEFRDFLVQLGLAS